jgi:hypothetical protein
MRRCLRLLRKCCCESVYEFTSLLPAGQTVLVALYPPIMPFPVRKMRELMPRRDKRQAAANREHDGRISEMSLPGMKAHTVLSRRDAITNLADRGIFRPN